jgi:glucuronokinase
VEVTVRGIWTLLLTGSALGVAAAESPAALTLYVAPGGADHNIMRYRASVEHDPKVLEVMRKKATLVDEARTQLLAGNNEALGPILTEDFDLRQSVYEISPPNLKMITIARDLGAHAKQTGSGGATIGTYKSEDQFLKLEESYRRHGCSTIRVNVVEYG